jgi:hypothetical protein
MNYARNGRRIKDERLSVARRRKGNGINSASEKTSLNRRKQTIQWAPWDSNPQPTD